MHFLNMSFSTETDVLMLLSNRAESDGKQFTDKLFETRMLKNIKRGLPINFKAGLDKSVAGGYQKKLRTTRILQISCPWAT